MYRTHYFKNDFMEGETAPFFQIHIHSDENPRMIRDLQSNLVGQLVVIPGIITNASRTLIRASNVVVRCGNCGHEKEIKVGLGYGGVSVPRACDNAGNPGMDRQKCKMDTYRVVTEKCDYIDQQYLKIQEAPELIPTGEMPRTFQLTCDRYLTDKVTPGNRVKIVGILSI